MPEFRVPITRDCTETTLIVVEAGTAEEAVEQALSSIDHTVQWEPDECSGEQSDPYFAGELGDLYDD